MEYCVWIWNIAWNIDILFAYIDKRKAHETSYRAVIMLGPDLEVCSSMRKQHEGVEHRNTEAETMGLPRWRQWQREGRSGSKCFLSTPVSEASQEVCSVICTSGRETQGSSVWKDLSWAAEFAMVRALIQSQICSTPDLSFRVTILLS